MGRSEALVARSKKHEDAAKGCKFRHDSVLLLGSKPSGGIQVNETDSGVVMSKFSYASMLWLVLVVATAFGPAVAGAAEQRFALVVGNDEYKAGKLATPANDAGLIATALQGAGFTVTGARNLDQATLRESFREFIGQVAAAGPDAVALVYLAGYGLQYAGENYFVPVDADIARDVDVPLQAIRISDFMQPLAALPGGVKIVILDAARQNPFARGGQPLASGLALVDPGQGTAVAYNAAPGTVGEDEPGPYGAYATALAEMIGAGGLGLDDLFARVRLRVSDATKGAEVPWFAAQLAGPFLMTERAAGAPPPPNVVPLADIRRKRMRDYSSAEDAYEAALALDTVEGYEQFLAVYHDGPLARRIAAMLAVRHEAHVWRRCLELDTPPAYWSYLRRYPQGPHAWDARRRLGMLRAQIEAPSSFAVVDFGYPPPPPDEVQFIGRPFVVFAGPEFGPPPPPPPFFLAPRPREFAILPPPPPPHERFFLPTPGFVVTPAFVRPPPTVAVRPPPPGGPAGRQAIPVSVPNAVHPGPGLPGPGPAGPAIVTPPHPLPQGHGAPPPPPPSAAVKPPPPPPHPAGPAPASVKPAPPPPPPPAGAAPASVKPAPPPPPPPPAGPAPASVKPAPPPPPTPHPAPPAPASAKPAAPPPPPPHPAGPPPSAAKPPPPAAPHPAAAQQKPACPPGKTAAEVNGHPVCK